MKRKIMLCLFVLLLIISLTGCGKDNVDVNTDDVTGTNTSDDSDSTEIELYSDSTKIVFQNANTRLVYYYSGDKITKYETYIDYQTSEAARYALIMFDKDGNIKDAYTLGRYLIIEYEESVYENLTTSEVRALYSYLKEVQKKIKR